MISKDKYMRENHYRALVLICAILCLVSFIYGAVHDNDWVSYLVAAGMLGLGALIQWSGEGAYQRYVDAVNKNPNDDLK